MTARWLGFLLFLDVLPRSPHGEGEADDRRTDSKSDDAKHHESERERDERKRARHLAGSFHPPRLDGVPKDPFKNDDANNQHDKPGDRMP